MVVSAGFLVSYYATLNAIQGNGSSYHPADIRNEDSLISSSKQLSISIQGDPSEDILENTNVLNIKAKERREKEREKSKLEKHLDPDWEEPASEEFAKWKANEVEKSRGKDARRELHDAKLAGEPDRSKKQLEIDNE